MKNKLKGGLTLNAVEQAPQQGTYLNTTDDGSVRSQQASIAFGPDGMAGASVQASFSQLKEIKELGRGSFGVVKMVEVNDTLYALKELQLTTDTSTQKNIYKELHSYLDYSHPFIIQTHNLYAQPNNKIFVLLELAKYGSAKDLLGKLKMGYINEAGLGMIAIDTLRAMDYIHKKNIIHRDIKPDNLLMTEDGRCKLADFGVATSILAHDNNQAQQTFAGSISYMAPERFKSESPYGPSSDVWSLGVTFVELLTGKFPYASFGDFFAAMQGIVQGPAPLLKSDKGYSNDCCALVNAMLEKDVGSRLSAGQLLQMPFCKKFLAKENEIRPIFARWIKDNQK
ncbi:Kinase [Hexamita inflata]|uniref:mitogen-activated protein kinase kinase n=1 Tax=Hexamita inflata TaxID=28002 RepID=A0AA86NNZ0_9EUKA|nr:Kinase [Hexamita inflata]